MSSIESPSAYLKKPARNLVASWVVYSLAVVMVFVLTEQLLPKSGALAPYLAALPGLSLGGYLVLFFFYFRHYDELLRSILLKSLSASAIMGFSLLLSSLVREDSAGFNAINDAVVISIMAIAFIVTALSLKWQYR